MHFLISWNIRTEISVTLTSKTYMIRSWAAGSKGVITLVPLVPWNILGLCCRMFSWLLTEGDGDRTYPWLPGLPGCSAPAGQSGGEQTKIKDYSYNSVALWINAPTSLPSCLHHSGYSYNNAGLCITAASSTSLPSCPITLDVMVCIKDFNLFTMLYMTCKLCQWQWGFTPL